MSKSEEQGSVSMSPEQLQAIITAAVTAAVAEAKKPNPPTEKELAVQKQAEDDRREQGRQELDIKAMRLEYQKRCTHKQPNGTAACADVPNLGALICLHCQALIKPQAHPKDEPGMYLYDQNLYWHLVGSRNTTTF